MENLYYIEDIFCEFMSTVSQGAIGLQHYDRKAAFSFYTTISNGQALTENQAKYVLKILFKYRNVAKVFFDYEDKLDTPMWKQSFRVVDNSKKIWIEQDENNQIWICLKFPYAFKDTFDTELEYIPKASFWNAERKIRTLKFYQHNVIQLYEWAKEHGFELSDEFMKAVTEVEEIWQNSEHYEMQSDVIGGEVFLINADDDAQNYFDNKKTGVTQKDLYLAKSMGFNYVNKPKTKIEKIAKSSSNLFWVKSQLEFLQLAYQIDGKVAIILDRNDDAMVWVKDLANLLDQSDYDRNDFRVCFRTSNKVDPEFNKWVTDNQFGGKIESAKFLIFLHKPAKWLFNSENDVIMYATNEILPSTNSHSRALYQSHPCVVYVGGIKPVEKEEEIIEL